MSKKHPFSINAKRTGKKVLLTLSGYIYPESDRNSSAAIADKLNEMEDGDELTVLIRNLNGGSVMEGMTIYHDLVDLKPTVLIDGVAASMGAIIPLAGKTIKMSRHSKQMLHRVTMGAYGDPDQIAEALEQAREYEDELVNIIAERTGLTAKETRDKYFTTGKDVWLDADDCMKAGLVDEVVKGSLRKDIPTEDLKKKQPEDVVALFEAAMKEEPTTEPKRIFPSTMSLFKKKTTAISALHNVKADELTPEQLTAADAELQADGVNAFLVPMQADAKNAEELSEKLEQLDTDLKAEKAKVKDLEAKLAGKDTEVENAEKKVKTIEKKLVKNQPETTTKKDPPTGSKKVKDDPMAVVHDSNTRWNKVADALLGPPTAAADPGDEEEEEKEEEEATKD